LVKFWASWCAPCSVLNPEFKEAKKIIGKKALLVEYNVDLGGKVLEKYNIEYLPTMIIFKNAKEVERTNSILNSNEIANWVLKYKN
jgi:thioredoxin 1